MRKVFACLTLLLLTAAPAGNRPLRAEEAQAVSYPPEVVTFFETKIRPVLVEQCFKCHGEGKHKGSLQLDNVELMLSGGDSGPALVPGNPEESLLIQAINYDGYEMPPGQKMSADKIADLTKWVAMGAPWPGPKGEGVEAVRKGGIVTDEDRQWWAFQSIKSPPLPELKRFSSPANPIDAFVLATLEQKNLTPNGPAAPHALVRRAFFDLIGLPPSPEEMMFWSAELSNADPGVRKHAWSRLIDDLLARPQYGERWGRHWLDVVRFAQTNGYEFDKEKTYAWRYRDYVINAFNTDKPYDQFVLEQLAGDELPETTPESIIATGFYRLGLWDFEPDDALQSEFDDLDDIVVTSSAAFLGLTMGCARCHDHKFDPISHKDYHALLAYFRNVRKYNYPDENPENPGLLPISEQEKIKAAFADREKRWAELDAKIEAETDPKEKEKLKKKREDKSIHGLEWAMAVREYGLEAKPTNVLIRGNAQTPGDEVQPSILEVLGGMSPEVIPPERTAPFQTCGRRLALAKWLISPENPLTARVMANRIWHYHFGRGIVPTTSDFGKVGEPPSHPELLDWLADDFRSSGWSIKQMHRRIMLSETYQRSSEHRNSAAHEIDPGNTLLWRQNLHRLDAESIRDSILAVSGNLNSEMGGRGFFPLVGEEVLSGGTVPGVGWESSTTPQRYRRSVYTFIKRSLVSPQLDTFDYANTSLPLTERPTTTVAPQALTLLNDMFMQKQAQAFARRVEQSAGPDVNSRIARAFQLALNRDPTPAELEISRNYLLEQREEFAHLKSRIMFRPIVPVALHPGYLKPLSVHEFVQGPESDWTPLRGIWNNSGTLDTRQGPCSLWEGAIFRDARVTAQITLGNAAKLAGILLRANADKDFIRGYEVVISPQQSEISIVRHEGEPKTLASIPAVIPTGIPLNLACEIHSEKIRVNLELPSGPVSLEAVDHTPLLTPGHLGARTWGASVTLDELALNLDELQIDVATAELGKNPPKSNSAHWSEFAGNWESSQDGILRTTRPAPGGKLIFNEIDFTDGVIEADVRVHGGGDAGIVVRVSNPQLGIDALNSYNINFSRKAIRIGKHQNNWSAMATAEHAISGDQWTHLKAVFEGGRVRIFVNHQPDPILDFTDPQPISGGKIGFRSHNCPVEFRNVSVTSAAYTGPMDLTAWNPPADSQVFVVGTKPDASERKALEAFCLMVLNLNEMIYVE